MIYLVGGFVALMLGLALWRTLATMDPRRLAGIARWVGIGLLAAIGLFLLTREAVMPALVTFGAAALLRYQARTGWRGRPAGGGSAGKTSQAETPWLRMTLGHETGETAGLVLQGAFRGRALAELTADELRALLAELRLNDAEGAQLLEAYLARVHPDLGAAPPPASSGAMTREEALEILGLKEGAREAEIREAHRRLMQQMHPDRGGSDYLAAKINAARDFLLG